jgi:hypothetical protein
MRDVVKDYWRISFLEQEEPIENIARMASITENVCFATFGESSPNNIDSEDALFTIRQLVAMIEDYRTHYHAAISLAACRPDEDSATFVESGGAGPGLAENGI